MIKKNHIGKDFKLFCPELFDDIEDIVEILQERETSILVYLENYLDNDKISEIIDFMLDCQTSYATIRVKKIFSNALICWSEHVNF